eukprot:4446431-Lingulodinium_polyedra.AAC.1
MRGNANPSPATALHLCSTGPASPRSSSAKKLAANAPRAWVMRNWSSRPTRAIPVPSNNESNIMALVA